MIGKFDLRWFLQTLAYFVTEKNAFHVNEVSFSQKDRPLDDIAELLDVDFVMKSGKVYKD